MWFSFSNIQTLSPNRLKIGRFYYDHGLLNFSAIVYVSSNSELHLLLCCAVLRLPKGV